MTQLKYFFSNSNDNFIHKNMEKNNRNLVTSGQKFTKGSCQNSNCIGKNASTKQKKEASIWQNLSCSYCITIMVVNADVVIGNNHIHITRLSLSNNHSGIIQLTTTIHAIIMVIECSCYLLFAYQVMDILIVF